MSPLDDEVMYDERPCPRCGEYEVRFRDCDVFDCEDGFIDEHTDDPINFAPGEEYAMCRECLGTGQLVWCSKCGLDITRHEHDKPAPPL